jgi:ubiquinone/menaquinone biosynthesis C-methylase UbiE
MWLSEATVPAARVLDVGCGTGNHGIALGELGFEVVGVDFAPAMLARASEKAMQREVGIDLRQLDVRNGLPFDDGSFDAALRSYILQVVGEPIGPATRGATGTAPGRLPGLTHGYEPDRLRHELGAPALG